ncbi:MAG: ethylbenzene dehydrogenase-related protein [Alphaproteobacteria bacterium]
MRQTAAILVLLASLPAMAAQGDAERGEAIYLKRCVWCHGDEGDGLGPAAARLLPPPRDFTLGQYKIKSTVFNWDYPNDDDIYRIIRDGMKGTAMPKWGDVLSGQDMWDLVGYLKTFAGLEEEEQGEGLDYGAQVESSPESIAEGKRLFHDNDRCSECHGSRGRGDAVKRLKGDNGERTWPRNLTKSWTFRASAGPRDIYTRISTGIPGTQMPSFANPKSKKKLTAKERWHIANYVASLALTGAAVRGENTVVKAGKAEGGVPDTPGDPRWTAAEPSTFFLVPQIVAKPRFFTPSNDTITVRALYDDEAIALLLEWDDRTKSIPGDGKAEEIAGPGMVEDRVAVQLPVEIPEKGDMEKPYFIRGDATHPVNLWQWRGGTTDQPESVALVNAQGAGDIEERDAAGLTAKGVYADGTWRVVMTRNLATDDTGSDLQFVEGRFIPVAFSAWDGSNGEAGAKHTMTTWYWLLLKPPGGLKPVVVALIVALLIGAGEIWWARTAARRREEDET